MKRSSKFLATVLSAVMVTSAFSAPVVFADSADTYDVSKVTTSTNEPNDTFETATELTIGKFSYGEIGSYPRFVECDNDVDFFKVNLAAGTTYRFEMPNYMNEFGDTTLLATFYTPSTNRDDVYGEVLVDTWKYAKADYFDYTASESGTFYIKLWNYFDYTGNRGDHPYGIRVTVATAATPTPAPTTAPTAKPTTKPSTPSTSESGVGGFVERLYTVAMNRDSDPSGKAYWENEVKVNGKTGADLALSFLLSDEFLNKSMTNDEFLEVLYKTFFDRAGEAGGKKYWTDEMTSGRRTKEEVIYGFINSEEWANICLTYGIKSGTDVQPTIKITPNSDIKAFAERLYTKCLGRASEADGLNYWADELANLRKSGSDVAYGFFFSDEIKGKNLSDKEFISRLYTTMMGREYDEGGMNYWLGQMKNGSTKEDVFAGFAGSAEWIGICADYGILR